LFYACLMKPGHPWRSGRAAITLALWPVIIVLSPVILLVGEPVNRFSHARHMVGE